MSNYFGFPISTDFSLPQQPTHSAMISATPGLAANGYSMPLAPIPLAAPATLPPQMPPVVAPAAATIPYISGYPGVYGHADPVQQMSYAMPQMPMQQQQQIPMFPQQTSLYQPQIHLTTHAMSQPPPPMPMQQQQQQPSWQQPIQQTSTSAANYHPVSQLASRQQQQSQQHQRPFRPQQQQQQQSFRPSQPQQQQQQQSFRPSQPLQPQQRPTLRPRVPAVTGQRPPPPSAAAPRPFSNAAALIRPPQPFSSMGRMRAPLGNQQAQLKPAPLFGKPNLRPVPSTPSNSTAAAKAGGEAEELQHCPLIPGGVGTEYVVQVRTEMRGAAALQYHCRLCDCRFTDIQARDLHVKGRRHRLQYKRKVDPRLAVDAKPSIKARHGGLTTQDSVAAAAAAVPSESANEAAMRRRREEEQRMRDMQELEWSNYAGCKHGGFWGGGAGQPRRPESNDDRQVLAKHSSVYPTEAELLAVQQLVTRCERALKLASDQLSSEAAPLRGVMRVGALAKGLLLHGDLATQLVLLCAAWPTKDLRDRVMQLLPERLEADGATAESSSGDEQQQQQKIEVRLDEEEGCIQVHGCTESESEGGCLKLTCSVYLTSPAVREEATDNPEPEGALDRDKCLEALAALRQAKWFQAKASSLQSCVPVIRVLRDLCQRLPVWGPLPEWAMELLVERSISSASGGQLLSPGEAVRRVMECLASGILLANGPGLRDPCEKAPVDAAASMTAQEREDVTASAQQALRLIALRRMHQVLDMTPLVPPPAPSGGDSAIKTAPVSAGSKRPASAAAPASAAPVTPTAAKQARLGQ